MKDYLNGARYKRRGGGGYKKQFSSKRGSNGRLVVLVSLGVMALVICSVYLILPKLLAKVGIEFVPPLAKVNTPTPTTEITPTPKLFANVDFTELQQEVVINAVQYKWFGDPYFNDDTLMFSAGELVGGIAKMTTLYKMDTKSGSSIRLNIKLHNSHLLYPVFNDDWLVYLDANYDGGGKIICCKMDDNNFDSPVLIKEVYTGQPILCLDGNYLSWTERTGSYMDKLFVCDLTTGETVTVQMFEKGSYYGTSKPSLKNGKLIWADAESEAAGGAIVSRICMIDIKSGGMTTYMPETYAHDPKTNGENYIAWMDGNHGPETKLYVSKVDGEKNEIATGVMDFYMDEKFVAYEANEKIYVYILADDETFELTQKYQSGQIMNAGAGYVSWIDTTSRERDVLKYAKIPA